MFSLPQNSFTLLIELVFLKAGIASTGTHTHAHTVSLLSLILLPDVTRVGDHAQFAEVNMLPEASAEVNEHQRY